MIKTDVLVIGGGPAGMACALSASEMAPKLSLSKETVFLVAF